MKKRKLAILSIGQKPCLRENDDILTRLPEDIEIMQYGALDGLTLEEIERDYAPGPGDVLLVGGACGVGVRLGEEKIVPRLQQRKKYRHISLCSGVGLHICIGTSENLHSPLSGQILYHVHALTASVIPFSRISFCVFVCQGTSHRCHNRLTDPVF